MTRVNVSKLRSMALFLYKKSRRESININSQKWYYIKVIACTKNKEHDKLLGRDDNMKLINYSLRIGNKILLDNLSISFENKLINHLLGSNGV